MELISVIVPVYNIETYLLRCLDSIAAQTYKNLEIILVNDGSTDGSGRLCEDFATKDPRVRVFHQENKGLSIARNVGMAAATGDFLFFPDGDDYFHVDIINLLYQVINTDSLYDVAIAQRKKTWNVDEDTSSEIVPHVIVQTRDEIIRGLFTSKEDSAYVYSWNKLYRRRVIKDILFRNYVRSQDFDFNFRVFLNVRKAVLIDNDLYFWLQHPGSLTKQKDSIGLMYMCRSRIFYQNYCELSEEGAEYGRYLLSGLYKLMVLYKAWSVYGDAYQDVYKECAFYDHSVRKSYLSCRKIPIYEKIYCFLLFHFPRLTRFLMKITQNM